MTRMSVSAGAPIVSAPLAPIHFPQEGKRTELAVWFAKVGKIARETPGVAHTLAIPGQSFVLNAFSPNYGALFIPLKPFHERTSPDQSGEAVLKQLRARLARTSLGDAAGWLRRSGWPRRNSGTVIGNNVSLDSATGVPVGDAINAMTKIESRTPKNRKFSTAERSALNIIGAGFGGVPIHASGPGLWH